MLAALIMIIAVTLYRVSYALAGSPGAWTNFSPLAAFFSVVRHTFLADSFFLPAWARWWWRTFSLTHIITHPCSIPGCSPGIFVSG